ncbi:hypothetical protein, partial [Pelomonas sp. KK5]|uniref:hypothetical protein n=1 Tax=Pelomonas sp. KK5 TaxID=1855730 RepID=UPI001301DC43
TTTSPAELAPAPPHSVPPMGKLGALLLLGSFAVAALLMFPGSGYRGLLALLGTMLLLLAMPGSAWLPSQAQRVTAVVGGALMAGVVAALCWALSEAVPKIAYLEYVIAFASAVLIRWLDRPGAARPMYLILISAAWFWLLAQVVIVAHNWGGPRASDIALACALPLGLLWPLVLLVPSLWPFERGNTRGLSEWRSRGLLLALVMLVGAVIAVLGGGEYMRQRISGTEGDMQTRVRHWKEGYWMLKSDADFAFGKGAGRYAANHFFMGSKEDHVGNYHWRHDAGEPGFLVLTGGQHMLGWGELFRVTQRVPRPEGPVVLAVRMRAKQAVQLHTELCEKHLLYADHCLVQALNFKPAELPAGQAQQPWQTFKVALGDGTGFGGRWYWPKLLAFSVALDAQGGVAEIAQLDLRDATGRELLANGDFDQDMSRWFFSSDKNHLPFHMKNLGLHVLFDQGYVGLILFGAMLLLALWRTCLGHGRDHPLAPALAASIVGFVGVGAFDSLLDAPRIAFMFYVVLAFALGLRALPGEVRGR